jgi:GntR family histidine utilization transcriptional repressor
MEDRRSITETSTASKSQPSPLYKQVKDYIIQQIESGAWPPDSRIPSENQIVELLGVSRMTVHRALRELTAEGRLIRLQGVGTFVSQQKPQSALLEIRNITDEIAERGGVHTCEVHLLAEEKVTHELALSMNLQVGSSIFHSIVVHRENRVPIQYSDRYVNPTVAPEYLQQDFTKIAPGKYLLSVTPLTKAEHIIEAQLPDRQVQKSIPFFVEILEVALTPIMLPL